MTTHRFGSVVLWVAALVAAAVVLAILSLVVLNPVLRLLALGAVLALVGYGVVRWMQSGGGQTGETAVSQGEDEQHSEVFTLCQQLAVLNTRVRVASLDESVRDAFEQVVDLLRGLLPEINDQPSGSERAWVVNRTATHYLPELIDPFLSLSPERRDARSTQLRESLLTLKEELERVKTSLEHRDEREVDQAITFIKRRFVNE